MFVSLMRQADLLWCCYNPIYDQSSGIFGRAIQIGRPTIVRKGSCLEGWQKEYGFGFAVDYGDIDALIAALDRPLTQTDRSQQNQGIAERAMNRLTQACR